jgi:hypothetical protein
LAPKLVTQTYNIKSNTHPQRYKRYTLTEKVDGQYNDLTTTVQTLADTIQKQNLIIAGIQQEYKLSMATLTRTFHPNPLQQISSTSSTWSHIHTG